MTLLGNGGSVDDAGVAHEFLQLPDESSRAFSCFKLYRDLGPHRSVDAAWGARSPGKSPTAPGHWWVWARRFRWLARARAFDEFLEKRSLGIAD